MQFFANRKKSDGSAILWAVIALGMLSVFILASLTVASGYSRRVTASNDELQAYYTARTVADAVAGRLAADQSLLPATPGATLDIAQVTGLPDEMGSASARIERLSDYSARVTVNALCGNGSYSYAADIAAECVEVPYFTSGLVLSGLDGTESFDIDGDLYLTGTAPSTLNCRVSGNVFAPGCAVTVGSAGFAGGSIFATGIAYQTAEPPLSATARNSITGLPSGCAQNLVPEPDWSSLFTGVLAAADPPPYSGEAAGIELAAPVGLPQEVVLNVGSTYYVRENIYLGADVTVRVQGAGDAVIVVKSGCTLTLMKAAECASGQNIAVVLQDGAALSCELPASRTLPLSVYGGENTAVHLTGSSQEVTVSGVFRIGSLTSAAPLAFSGGSGGAAGSKLVPISWTAVQRREGQGE